MRPKDLLSQFATPKSATRPMLLWGLWSWIVRRDWRYQKDSFLMDRSKTARPLGPFDWARAEIPR